MTYLPVILFVVTASILGLISIVSRLRERRLRKEQERELDRREREGFDFTKPADVRTTMPSTDQPHAKTNPDKSDGAEHTGEFTSFFGGKQSAVFGGEQPVSKEKLQPEEFTQILSSKPARTETQTKTNSPKSPVTDTGSWTTAGVTRSDKIDDDCLPVPPRPASSPVPTLPARRQPVTRQPANLLPLMQVGVSTVFLGCALVIVMSHTYDAQEKHWAYGTLGTILGFWLKGTR